MGEKAIPDHSQAPPFGDRRSADARRAVERVFKEESGAILATLIRVTNDFELAEDAMQEAFAVAIDAWAERGPPTRPGAWITTTARRRAIDRLRRTRTFADKRDAYETLLRMDAESSRVDPLPDPERTGGLEDDRLRLIFTCCHPALSPEARVALTLRTVGGLTTREIARAFLVPEATMAQRIVRAKRKIKVAGIPYAIPGPEELPERVEGVSAVLYLIFNEGYSASGTDQLLREELSEEAIRLGRLLEGLMTEEAEVKGLLALMLLHHSRRRARTDSAGRLVTLEDQDRALWDRQAIAEGLGILEQAAVLRRPGPYQLQAAIVAVHAQAESAAGTEWSRVVRLYDRLLDYVESPVVALNRAAALGMAEGPDAGLQALDSLATDGALANYYLFHAARGDLLRRADRFEEAVPAYEEAWRLCGNPVERSFLERRLEELSR